MSKKEKQETSITNPLLDAQFKRGMSFNINNGDAFTKSGAPPVVFIQDMHPPAQISTTAPTQPKLSSSSKQEK